MTPPIVACCSTRPTTPLVWSFPSRRWRRSWRSLRWWSSTKLLWTFCPPDEQPSLVGQIARWPNLVILRSLTKFYSLPGLRLGYAIAHPTRLQRWQQWRDPWPVNALAAAAAAVLQDQPFQQQTWQWLAAARPALYQALQTIPGLHPFPGQANYLLVHCDRSVSALQRELLQRDRILIRDCLSFPELGDRYFRIAIRRPAENDRLVAALQRVMEAEQ